jgi:hypothetical protein
MSLLSVLALTALNACTGGGADAPREIVIGEYGSLSGTAASPPAMASTWPPRSRTRRAASAV